MSILIKMRNLQGILDTVSSWGYRDSKKVNDGIAFCVDTPNGYPGEVFVAFRRLDELIVREVRLRVEKSGLELRVTDVPQDKLFEVIDKMIKGRLSEKDCESLSKQYRKELYKAVVSCDLSRMHDIIMGNIPWNQAGSRKGIIVTDDGIHLDSKFAKEHLKYDVLKMNGKVNEITIDSSWPLNNEVDGEEYALWKRLQAEASKVRQGLLVINILDINMFKHCWDLKQLVKQEKLDFHGYVLLVIKDMDWEKEVKKFIEDMEDSNIDEFKVMMGDFYRLI
jgi:hypothetical protein